MAAALNTAPNDTFSAGSERSAAGHDRGDRDGGCVERAALAIELTLIRPRARESGSWGLARMRDDVDNEIEGAEETDRGAGAVDVGFRDLEQQPAEEEDQENSLRFTMR